MLARLYWAAATWTTLGLLSGLAYREVTKAADFHGRTQLAFVHTHTLALGTLVMLLALVLERTFTLSASRWARWFFWVWNVGLAITATMLTVKGVAQVHHESWVDSPALAGVAGLGHMTLTAGFILLFCALKPALTSRPTSQVTS